MPGSVPIPLDVRFARYVKPAGLNECWIWSGFRNEHGYGRMWVRGMSPQSAHRVAWQLANGPIPQGMNVLHRCDNPPCCNPNHLFLGTQTDNNNDKLAKGRARGPRVYNDAHWSAKLTDAEVREIRTRYGAGGVTQRQLARDYGVTQAQISHILLRKQRIERTMKPKVNSRGFAD